MKKKIIGILMIGVLLSGVFRVGMIAGAASGSPGSANDPLISKSYLEKRLSEISTETSEYKKISVTKGKILITKEGCEFIVYSGEATVTAVKGLVDLSEGLLIAKGSKVSKYHHYFSPSQEGGIKSTENCIIYVKGSYSIE